MFKNRGLKRRLTWGAALTIVGMLGLLLPVALASTRSASDRATGSAAIRVTVADGTTTTEVTTTDTTSGTGTDTDTTDTGTTDDTGAGTDTSIVVTGDQPTEVVGQLADIEYSTGTVLVKVPGATGFVNLISLQQMPIGSVINATHGLLKLTFGMPSGTTQTATFWNGEFSVNQNSTGAVDLPLTGSSFAGCPKPAKLRKRHTKSAKKHRTSHLATTAKAKQKKKGTKVRSLWADATGSFTTTGHSGAAAVLGTEWLTIDQCDGTFFYVKKASDDPLGQIRVTVFYPRRHIVLLKRGHFLLAPAAGYPSKGRAS